MNILDLLSLNRTRKDIQRFIANLAESSDDVKGVVGKINDIFASTRLGGIMDETDKLSSDVLMALKDNKTVKGIADSLSGGEMERLLSSPIVEETIKEGKVRDEIAKELRMNKNASLLKLAAAMIIRREMSGEGYE